VTDFSSDSSKKSWSRPVSAARLPVSTCRDDGNRLYGHVQQIASNERLGLILIQCPRCLALYENAPAGPDQTRRVSKEEATERFRR